MRKAHTLCNLFCLLLVAHRLTERLTSLQIQECIGDSGRVHASVEASIKKRNMDARAEVEIQV